MTVHAQHERSASASAAAGPGTADGVAAAVVASRSRSQKLVRSVLKWLVPLALLGWLLGSGRLDLSALGRVFGNPLLFAANSVGWAMSALVIAALRWQLLLRGLGFSIGFLRAVRLQFVALFANTAVPGNVAGDVLKNVLAARDIPELSLMRSLTCVMVERVMGLSALVLIAAVSVSLRFEAVYQRAPSLVWFVYLLFAGTLFAMVAAVVIARWMRRSLRPSAPPPAAEGFIAKVLLRVSDVGQALRAYGQRPTALLGAFGLSVLMHAVYITLFVMLGQAVAPTQLAVLDLAIIYPMGMLTSILPLAPGGIGIGHAAFDKLFELFGASHGADVFNVFLVGQLVPNLFGILPYLASNLKASEQKA